MNTQKTGVWLIDWAAGRKRYGVIYSAALLLLIGGLWGAREAGVRTDARMRRNLLRQAQNIAATIYPGDAASLSFTAEDINSSAFEQISSQMRAYAGAAGFRSLYSLGLRGGQLRFGPESLDPDDPYASPPGTVYENPSKEDFEIFQTGKPIIQGPASDEYGTFISATAPVVNPFTKEVVMTVGIDVEASIWQAQVHKVQLIFLLLALIPLSILFLGYFILKIRSRASPQQYRHLRHTEAVTCALIMLLLTLMTALLFQQAEKQSREEVFYSLAQIKAGIYAELLQNVRTAIYTLVQFSESNAFIDQQKFETYCSAVVGRDAVLACLWAPAVSNKTVSGEETLSYPILYAEPANKYGNLTGYDLLSNPSCRKAIERTLRTDRTTATDPLALESSSTKPSEVLIVRPVCSKYRQGIAGVVIRPEAIVIRQTASSVYERFGLAASLFQLQENTSPLPLACPKGMRPADSWESLQNSDLSLLVPAFVFGKAYGLLITPEPAWLEAHPLRHGRMALFTGLVLTLLLTCLISVLANRPAVLERLIQQRTAELKFTQFTLDHSADAAYRVSPEARIIYVNESACQQLGYTQKELLDIFIPDIDPGFPEERWHQHWRELKEKGSLSLETTHRRKDGQTFPVEIHVSYIQYDNQEYACAFAHDITERKLAEEKLQHLTNIQSLILDNSTLGIALVRHRVFEWVNPRLCELLGRSTKKVQGQSTRLLYSSQEKYEEMEQTVYADLATAGRSDSTLQLQRSDGSFFWCRLIGTALDPEHPDNGSLWMFEDTTERHRNEEQLHRQAMVLDQIQDGITVTDLNGIITYMNRTELTRRNLSREKIIGKSISSYGERIKGDFSYYNVLKQTLETGNWQGDITVIRAEDQTERQIHCRTQLIHNAKGEPVALCEISIDVTEQARIQEELKFTQFALEHIGDPVFLMNSDSSLSYVNEAACEALGYSREELLQLSIPEIDPGVTFEMWKELWNEVHEKKVAQFETTHQTKDGKIFPVEIHSNSIIFKGREHQFAFANDITTRKQAEEKLRQLTDIQSLILNNSTLGIALVRQRNFEWVNPRLCEMLLRMPEDVQGQSTRLLYPSQETYEETGRTAYTALATGGRSDNTIQFQRSDGSLFWCRLIGKALNPENPNDGSLWMFEDITEQSIAKAELQRLSTAIEQSPETVLITDANSIIQYANPAFEKTSGYSRTEALGATPRILQSGKHDNVFYASLWETIQSGKTWNGRFFNKRKTGEIYIDEASISPVRDPKGEITGYVSVQRDITEELAKEERFRQSQKMEAVGQLAGGVAHDFNNILQAILGFSEILLNRLNGKTLEYQNVFEIRKAAQRAAELTRQLLAFSRKQTIDRQRINLNTTIQDTLVLLQLLLTDKIDCVFNPESSLYDVFADPGQITQIIMNLAVNARDAMPDGGTLTLTTENMTISPPGTSEQAAAGTGEKNYICLSITDTGSGMSPNVQEHLFEPFFTTKAVGEGTGLGLAVVYGIVKQNKGWIHVCSEENKGATFKIYLPACTIDTETISDSEAEQILLVEDEEDTLNMVLRILETAGYKTLVAKSAEEAIEQFEQHSEHIALLFSDIMLPEKNGVELANILRTKNPDLAVLLYSGYRNQRERWQDFDSKRYRFMQKPFSVADLLASVHEALMDAHYN